MTGMYCILHANELATCQSYNNRPVVGSRFSDCGIIQDCAVVIDGETIVAVGKTDDIYARYRPDRDSIIDASGKIVLPGFVDCHTHTVFAGSRADEYGMKLKGQSYSDLHKKKGGIHLTVEATRSAREGALFELAKKRLREMLVRGSTTIEIKTGYGLSLKDELKTLRVIKRLQNEVPQDIIATFLGAHTVPLEFKDHRHDFVRMIISEMLPSIAAKNLAEYCDVFCDPLGFDVEESRKILEHARKLGMKTRIHAEQTARIGGIALAAECGSASADHCDFAEAEDIKRLKESGTAVVLLPGVLLHLQEWNSSPVRKVADMIKANEVPLVLATDYNPGSSPIVSMKLVMDFALRFLGLDYNECLNASTVNAAYALDRIDRIGSIEEGKQADILLIDAPTVKDYLHHIGDKNIELVIKRGVIVHSLSQGPLSQGPALG